MTKNETVPKLPSAERSVISSVGRVVSDMWVSTRSATKSPVFSSRRRGEGCNYNK